MFGASEYCAFEVRVANQSGTPARKVPVYLIKNQHITISSTTTDGSGLAKLCDSPLTAVDIGVGVDVCGSVLIRDLRATWPETQRVFVTYAETHCNHFVFDDQCQILLRIQDEDGKAIPEARLTGHHSPGGGADVSDSLGRLYRLAKTGENVKGVISKEGRESVSISEKCTIRGEPVIERTIVLHGR